MRENREARPLERVRENRELEGEKEREANGSRGRMLERKEESWDFRERELRETGGFLGSN